MEVHPAATSNYCSLFGRAGVEGFCQRLLACLFMALYSCHHVGFFDSNEFQKSPCLDSDL
ncbi:hypothetical protein Ancab_012786 [Ancistrocladus abbreviatus]